MRTTILGTLPILLLVTPAWAQCQLEEDQELGVFWNCSPPPGWGGGVASAGGGASAPGAPACGVTAADCPNQGIVGRDGSPTANALGFAAAATGFGVAAVSGNVGAMAAAAFGIAATAADAVGEAASSGAVGSAAAASAGEGGGF